MKKWQIAPLGLAAAGALAAGIVTLLRKDGESPAGEKAAPSPDKKPEKQLCEGSYSFVAGYRDASTVELTVRYDPEAFSFSVIEDDFLSITSDSHAAVLFGEDFNMQIEYAEYYSGEDFAGLRNTLSEKYKGFEDVRLSSAAGYRYLSGDSLCFCLPAGASYVLITVLPAKDSKETAETLPGNAELMQILNSIVIQAK